MSAQVFRAGRRVRVVVAITILIVASTLSTIARKDISAKLPFKLLGIEEFRPDQSLNFFLKARAMKLFLPPRGTVGYITDTSTCPYDTCGIVVHHALAPLRLEGGAEHFYVLGYLLNSAASLQVTQMNSLEVVHDFGDGSVILRKRQ